MSSMQTSRRMISSNLLPLGAFASFWRRTSWGKARIHSLSETLSFPYSYWDPIRIALALFDPHPVSSQYPPESWMEQTMGAGDAANLPSPGWATHLLVRPPPIPFDSSPSGSVGSVSGLAPTTPAAAFGVGYGVRGILYFVLKSMRRTPSARAAGDWPRIAPTESEPC